MIDQMPPDGVDPIDGEDDELIEYDLVEELVTGIRSLIALQQQQLQMMAALTAQLSRRKVILRDEAGRVAGVTFE